MVHFLFSFLTLCLGFQYSHNDLLLLSKESVPDPVTDTFSTRGTTKGSADVFLPFRQPHESFRSHSMNACKLARGENHMWILLLSQPSWYKCKQFYYQGFSLVLLEVVL